MEILKSGLALGAEVKDLDLKKDLSKLVEIILSIYTQGIAC